jgi:hypothetical protein
MSTLENQLPTVDTDKYVKHGVFDDFGKDQKELTQNFEKDVKNFSLPELKVWEEEIIDERSKAATKLAKRPENPWLKKIYNACDTLLGIVREKIKYIEEAAKGEQELKQDIKIDNEFNLRSVPLYSRQKRYQDNKLDKKENNEFNLRSVPLYSHQKRYQDNEIENTQKTLSDAAQKLVNSDQDTVMHKDGLLVKGEELKDLKFAIKSASNAAFDKLIGLTNKRRFNISMIKNVLNARKGKDMMQSVVIIPTAELKRLGILK